MIALSFNDLRAHVIKDSYVYVTIEPKSRNCKTRGPLLTGLTGLE